MITLSLLGLLLFSAGSTQGPPPADHMHPAFEVLDSAGAAVLESTQQADSAKTCGGCHDVTYINTHASHAEHTQSSGCFTCHAIDNVDGRVTSAMAAPPSTACGQCHGLVGDRELPVELGAGFLSGGLNGSHATTLKTGEVFSAQSVSESFVNLKDKNFRSQPWDAHAARGLECTSCHYAANNPNRPVARRSEAQEHLSVDPRRISIGSYLKRPDHRLQVAGCADCHDTSKVHKTVPYMKRHLDALACQACHTSDLSMPALRTVDYTVLTPRGPRTEHRGVLSKEQRAPNAWFSTGYRPYLLEEPHGDGTRFAPFNVVAEWRWVSGTAQEPVPKDVLERVWFLEDGGYVPELIQLLDRNEDASLDDTELLLDTDAKVAAISDRLETLGVVEPSIAGVVRAYPIRHGTMEGKHVEAACEACHGATSRFNEDILLSDQELPGHVLPVPDAEASVILGQRQIRLKDGKLQVTGRQEASNRYIIGHSRRPWSDLAGLLIFMLTGLGVAIHAGFRYVVARRAPPPQKHVPMKRVYMYMIYERFWHWTMAASVILLTISGFQLHYPQSFSWMSLPTSVFLHNVMAAVLIANSFLSLFFHVATGEIHQFVPERQGMLKRLLEQAWYYGRGMFVGAVHPTSKTPERKLNPLQQVTYFGLLNVLFPLQIITGVLLWIGGMAPSMLAPLGGIALVAPLHNLISWLFLTFVVMHVYLTTTGHTLTSNLKAMVDGWDEIDADSDSNADGLDDEQGVKS